MMVKTLVAFRLSAVALSHLNCLAEGKTKTAAVEKALELAFAVQKARETDCYTENAPAIQLQNNGGGF